MVVEPERVVLWPSELVTSVKADVVMGIPPAELVADDAPEVAEPVAEEPLPLPLPPSAPGWTVSVA